MYLRIITETHWGYSLLAYTGTKSRPALRFPAPTTLVGALAYPLAKLLGWPENYNGSSSAEKVRKFLEGVYVSANGPLIIHGDLSKIWWYKVRERRVVSDAAALQRIFSPRPVILELLYIIDKKSIESIVGEDWEKILLAAASSLSRLGSKESIISVLDVKIGEAISQEAEELKTRFMFPLEDVSTIEGDYIVMEIIDWRKTRIGAYTAAPRTTIGVPYDRLLFRSTEVTIRYRRPRKAWLVEDEIVVGW